METILKRGQMVVARAMQSACIVQDLLGEGGQAEVYRARIGSRDYALKWYRPEYIQADPRLWERLRQAINAGSPTEQFLWPFDLVSLPGVPAYGGYVMPLKPDNYVSLVDLLRRKCEPTFRSLATSGFQLAHSFFRLHALGLCYRDVNFGNIFFDPSTGDIFIGDTDNVDFNRKPGGIMGTWGFMAPEVGRQEAEPSAMTDRYSLAVLLFYMFMLGHPLKGKRETQLPYDPADPDGSRRLCADHPVFVFDPQDDSNRPVPGLHDVLLNFWYIYPASLRNLFTRAFTEGLKDPDARVMENEWRWEMCRMRDSILHCGRCGAENFFDVQVVRQTKDLHPCWSCGFRLSLPARMRLIPAAGRSSVAYGGNGSPGAGGAEEPNLVMLLDGTRLYPHHLEGDPYNFANPLAAIETHGGIPVLRNLSPRAWTSRSATTGELTQVTPGGALTLDNGRRIHFGECEAEVRM
jgi:serine/threonine protein kinase